MAMQNIADLLDRWPSIEAVAEDAGVTPNQPYVWKHRGNVPPRHWLRLVEGARKRKIEGVTYEALAKLTNGVAA